VLPARRPIDADRALHLVEEVLARRPDHDRARSIAIGLHTEAGRWGRVDAELAARVTYASTSKEAVLAWLRRADIQRGPLGAPVDALESLRSARGIDPGHPSLAEAIAGLVEATSDARSLRDATIALAKDAPTVEERVRHRLRAAEIDELALEDDAAAEEGYAAALVDAPGDPWIVARLARVAARRAREKPEAPPPPAEIEAEMARDPRAAHALRGLEELARSQGSKPLLANALDQQAKGFAADAPVLGALWAEADLIEWSLPPSEGLDVYERILARAPGDRAALDALLRRARPRARGDAAVRDATARALSGLLGHATDDGARLALRLALATVLDPGDALSVDPTVPLAHYRAALQLDPRSPTAAFGAGRLAPLARDTEAQVVAACARAELLEDGPACAALLVQAAGLLASAGDARLGAPAERKARAIDLLERALVADPCSPMAAGMLGPLCMESGGRDRLIAALRGALERADRRDAIARLGLDLARVTSGVPGDRPIAIAALERVRASDPEHLPALFALGEVYAAERAWPEAILALEAAALHARDPQAKKRALLALADSYARTPERSADAERALRGACDADPTDARPLRGLLERLRAPDRAGAPGTREEIAAMLGRLVEAETAPAAQAALYLELVDARAAIGDRIGAEKALVEAAARAPGAQLLARILGWSPVPSEQARILAAVARRGTDLGNPDMSILSALAQIEIDVLGRAVDGVAHARTALAANPADAETRAVLARGLGQSGRHGEAIAAVLALVEPDPAPVSTLRDPAAPLAVLDASLAADRREVEATVARELRALAGGVDDATVVALWSRRLAPPRGARLDRDPLVLHVVPTPVSRVLLDVAAAVAGVESRVFPEDLGDVGLSTRDRVASGHSLRAVFDRVARTLGVDEVELAVGDDVPYPRVISRSEPWVVAPSSILARPEPVQVAAFARVLARITLGTPWIERLPPAHVRAFLVAAARTVAPGWAAELRDRPFEEAITTYAGPLSRAIGRKQKKALAAVASAIESVSSPTAAAVDAFVLGLARTEARASFLVGGNLLATFEELRSADADLARATATRSPAALVAALAHPIVGDLLRFALTPAATGLRRELGSI
jgi:tetratricopeptide (TPR) repeat protein